MLESSGTDSNLVKFLLRDARLWGILSKLLEDQITTLHALHESYQNKSWTVLNEEDLDQLQDNICAFYDKTDILNHKVQNLLGNLTATSQNLIQLVR